MITHRQIKSRFTKRHLFKVVGELLNVKMGSDPNRNLLELRPNMSIAKIVDHFDYCRVKEESKNGRTVTYVEVMLKGDPTYKTLRILGKGFQAEGWDTNSDCICTGESIDRWIFKIFRRDKFFKDNSAISVCI